jgi:hypothetical protein
MADFREMIACLKQVPKAHPPIVAGNGLGPPRAAIARGDR